MTLSLHDHFLHRNECGERSGDMKPVIELREIRKVYHTRAGTVYALRDATLSIPEGSFTAIVGRSGSGKSTLMNILGCLDKPTEGEYLLDGVPVSELKERRLTHIRNRRIGFIFQGFHLIPSLTAQENVELPLVYRGIPRAMRHALAKDALIKVGLAGRMEHKPGELSGGQQQRVAIARAIASSPGIILADEPTGNLDETSGRDVMQLLTELHQNGATLVLITHDNGIAAMAESCIKISDGRIVF